jgi:hypothetical protein
MNNGQVESTYLSFIWSLIFSHMDGNYKEQKLNIISPHKIDVAP